MDNVLQNPKSLVFWLSAVKSLNTNLVEERFSKNLDLHGMFILCVNIFSLRLLRKERK
jgi:hypothetical protein